MSNDDKPERNQKILNSDYDEENPPVRLPPPPNTVNPSLRRKGPTQLGQPLFSASVSTNSPRTGRRSLLSNSNAYPSDFVPDSPMGRRRPQLPPARMGIMDMMDGEGETVASTPFVVRKGRRNKKKKSRFYDPDSESVIGRRERQNPGNPRDKQMEGEEKSTNNYSDDDTFTETSNDSSKIRNENESEDPDFVEEDSIRCLVAKTALILAFNYKRNGAYDKSYVLKELTGKKTTILNKDTGRTEEVKMWKYREKLPKEVGDLTPLFRGVLGWKDSLQTGPAREELRDRSKPNPNGNLEGTWTAHRLVLNPAVLKDLFEDAQLFTIQNGKEVSYQVKIEQIELMIYPLGSAFLVFHIDWIGGSEKKTLSLPDVRTLLFVSKYRHKLEGLSLGWCFTSKSSEDRFQTLQSEEFGRYRYHSGEMFEARYNNTRISLSAIGNWLLSMIEENPTAPISRFDYPRHAHHHSTVVLDREPSSVILQEYLFHLRRAFGQSNRPPIEKSNDRNVLGQILVWRVNRYVGISREGTVSLSWTLSDSEKDFERSSWHTKFQGIYLLLQLHALAEKLVFLELSDMAAANAERLQMVADASSFENIKNIRDQLRELSSRLVRYTISMSTNDCGGISEYSEFFGCLRASFAIPELRKEISGELKDFLALLESFYWEEEKRKRDEAAVQRNIAAESTKKDKERRDAKDRRFELVISILGSISVPFAVVGGILGMNLDDIPHQLPFWAVMGVTAAFSLALFLLMFFWRVSIGDWILSKKQAQKIEDHNNRNRNSLPLRRSMFVDGGEYKEFDETTSLLPRPQ